MAAGVRLRAALAEARYGVRARRRRSLLTALGIALAAAMLSAAIVVSDGLGRGFDRAARAAQLPDIIVRFNSQPTDRVAQRIESLPDVAAFSLRQEVTNVDLSAGEHFSSSGSVEVVGPGRRGYAIVAGREMSQAAVRRGRGRARAGAPRGGSGSGARSTSPASAHSGSSASPRAPTTSPTRSRCRAYMCRRLRWRGRFGGSPDPQVDLAQIWLRDPRYLNEVLVQAREISYGLQGLQFVTRSGVRVLLARPPGS